MNHIFEYDLEYDQNLKDFYVTYKNRNYAAFNPRKSVTELTNPNKKIIWKEKKLKIFLEMVEWLEYNHPELII
jgi:hypothetical protein